MSLDAKNKLDSIIRKNIINTIDQEDVRKYIFGDGTVYIKYNEETKKMEKNFTTSSPEYSSFKVNLTNKIKSEFQSSLGSNAENIRYHVWDVVLNYQDISYGGKNVYLPFISVKYVVSFETNALKGVPIVVNDFTLKDPDNASGEISISKSNSRNGYVNVAISGKTTVRYYLKYNK